MGWIAGRLLGSRANGRVVPAATRTRRCVLFATLVVLGATSLLSPVAGAAGTCPNEGFRSGPSAHLPDCRAYEMVTPLFKNGAQPFFVAQSQSGDRVALQAFGTLTVETGNKAGEFSTYFTERTPEGWKTISVDPPSGEFTSPFRGGFSEIFGSYIDAMELNGGASVYITKRVGEAEQQIYVRTPSGGYEHVGPAGEPGTETRHSEVIEKGFGIPYGIVGASKDLSHLLYSYPVPWEFANGTGEEGTGEENLYEYIGRNQEQPLLVGVNEAGKLISTCGTELGSGNAADRDAQNAVSSNGLKIFFTPNLCTPGPSVYEVYARVDNGTPEAQTVDISEPSAQDCKTCNTTAPTPAVFVAASEDGSRVYFETTQPLLGADTSTNLYEYDFNAPAGERILRVTGGDSTVSEPTADLDGVAQVSPDGSHVYFVAGGVLTTTPNDLGQVAQLGAFNLYVFDAETNQTSFITDLSEIDGGLWGARGAGLGDSSPIDTSANGDFLAFESVARLTPDDTSGTSQLFEYDAQTKTLARASIGENGYNFNGNTNTLPPTIFSPQYATCRHCAYVPSVDSYMERHVVANNGAVFFESADPLMPAAVSDPRGDIHNVYEYHNGNVYLISDGTDTNTVPGEEGPDTTVSRLLGVDESGANVFLETDDPLVLGDTDEGDDIYDARVDGGITPPPGPPQCEGDACQGQLTGAPVLLSPSSEFQVGGENFQALQPKSNTPTRKPPVVKKKKKRKKSKKARRARRAPKRVAKGNRRGK